MFMYNVDFNTAAQPLPPTQEATFTVVHKSRKETTCASMEVGTPPSTIKRLGGPPSNETAVPFKISPQKKKKAQHCCAYGCSNDPIARKGGLCHMHYKRKRRALAPMETRYNQFKHNALRRGKEFTITYKEFARFCKETGYLIKKGIRGYAATIDRIDNSRGYHLDNIQLLSMRANVTKYHSDDKRKDDPDYCPF